MGIQNTQLKAYFLFIVSITVIALLFFIGCDNQTEEISAELGEEVELKLGQTVSIEAQELKVKFVEVIGDSRCPTGATCVWEGEVSCTLEITYLDETYTTTITQPGLTDQFSADTFQEYEINYNVEPYPEVDKEIKSDEYRLLITINK